MSTKSKIVLDKANLDIKTKKIEQSLLPWINQLVKPDPKFSAWIPKGKSKSIPFLLSILIESIDTFALKSNEIADEFPEIQKELKKELANVKDCGNKTIEASNKFTSEPTVSEKRISLSVNAQKLLCAVARVLAIVDLIDEQSIVRYIEAMLKTLMIMKKCKKDSEFMTHFKEYGQNLKNLLNNINKSVEVFALDFEIKL